MPVIQGWKPSDYRSCVAQIEYSLFGDPGYIEGMGHGGWPALIGVGSVCRRSVLGKNGLMRVLDTLEGVLPTYVRFHLFDGSYGGLEVCAGPRAFPKGTFAFKQWSKSHHICSGI